MMLREQTQRLRVREANSSMDFPNIHASLSTRLDVVSLKRGEAPDALPCGSPDAHE